LTNAVLRKNCLGRGERPGEVAFEALCRKLFDKWIGLVTQKQEPKFERYEELAPAM